jgi:hypothetical protein
MSDTTPRHRLIQNELLVRDENKRAKQVIQAHTPREEQSDLVIQFYCECSDLSCTERIGLTLQQYQRLHARNDRFIIAVGHQSSTVERIVNSHEGYLVVEKYALPA